MRPKPHGQTATHCRTQRGEQQRKGETGHQGLPQHAACPSKVVGSNVMRHLHGKTRGHRTANAAKKP